MHSVKFNALMNTMLTGLSMFVSVITIPYVTRVLSVNGYGDVSFAQSISSWLSALCLMGIGTYGIRECAKVRDDPIALATVVKELLIIITLCTSVVLSLFAVGIVFIERLHKIAPLMWMFLVGTLLLSYGVEWFYQGIEQYAYITIRSIVFKILSLIAILLFVRNENNYLIYGAILALVICGNNFFNIIRLARTVNLRDTYAVNIGRHIKPLASFGSMSIASALYLSFDSTILGMLSSNYQIGLYQLAVKIKGIMFQVLNAILGVFIPRLSYYIAEKKLDEYNQLLRKGFIFTLNVTFALMCYLLVFAEPIVLIISGEKFLDATLSVRICGFINMFSCLSYFLGLCILAPTGREKELAVANCVGVPTSIILNFALDSRFGAIGASTAALISELIIFSMQGWYSRRELKKIIDYLEVVKIITANILATAISYSLFIFIFPSTILSQFLLSSLTYFGSLLALLFLMREEFVSSLYKNVFKLS